MTSRRLLSKRPGSCVSLGLFTISRPEPTARCRLARSSRHLIISAKNLRTNHPCDHPTEPIGSIPHPLNLIVALAGSDGASVGSALRGGDPRYARAF